MPSFTLTQHKEPNQSTGEGWQVAEGGVAEGVGVRGRRGGAAAGSRLQENKFRRQEVFSGLSPTA